MNIANLRIGARLGAGFGMVLLLMIALIVVGTVRLASIGDTTRKMTESDWTKMELVNVIDTTTRTNARRSLELFIAPDKAYSNKVYQQIESNRSAIDGAIAALEKLVTLPEGKALLETLKQARERYVISFGNVRKLVDAGQRDEAARLIAAETLPALDALQDTVRQLHALQKKGVEDSGAFVRRDIESARLLMTGLGLVAAIIAIALAYGITRSVTRPIHAAIKVAQTVAAGDLTSHIDVGSTDEVGQLMQALKNMNDSLLNIVGEVRSGTDTISAASTQIASGNLDLSARTEQQASSLEETASSMEELTSTVRQNADNARQANVLAGAASEVAVKGGVVVARVVDTMNSINQSSRKIVDIIAVIDSIAFQTNILALNAAVEAARAGEQGRGFAVVASEVRNLAQRSASAAREIKTLIVDSVEQVGIGAQLVGQAGATMEEIVTSVRRVTDIMSEMTAAAHEQTSGIEQINQAICQMDEVTQQNAALVEEAAAAAGSLQDQATHLTRVVGIFTIGAAATGAPARQPGQQPGSNHTAMPPAAARLQVSHAPAQG